jgi:hypothetical protein
MDGAGSGKTGRDWIADFAGFPQNDEQRPLLSAVDLKSTTSMEKS